jgi:hypothetical protein
MTTAELGPAQAPLNELVGWFSFAEILVEAGSNEVFNFNLIDPLRRRHSRS